MVDKREEQFIPGCQFNPKDSTYDCKPKWERRNKPTMTVNQPVKVKMDNGKPVYLNTGDASELILQRLDNHISRKGLK